MSLWKARNQANGAPIWAPALKKQAPTATNANDMFSNTSDYVVGISSYEINSNSSLMSAHTGWVRKVVGSGGRSGRIQTEVLVAGGIRIGANGASIEISTNPSNKSVNTGLATTFSVGAIATPAVPLTYLWQYSINSTAAFANLTANSTYSNTDKSTLAIANVAGLNGFRYRVVVLSQDSEAAQNATSSNATLTVV